MKYPLSNIQLTALERQYVNEALQANWISGSAGSPFLARFESLLEQRHKRMYALAVANGTVALELALRTLDIGLGDYVIVPALTFAAPVAAVLNVGAKPLIVDIDPDTWTISPEAVADLVGSTSWYGRIKAVIAVDLLGHPCDFGRLYEAAQREGIPIIEDAAQAHGATYYKNPTGTFGDISTFSYHANKAITTGEGGSFLTNKRELYDRAKRLMNHGMTPGRPYYHEEPGTNYRMTNVTAAIGTAQMERWIELMAKRSQVAKWYGQVLPSWMQPRPVAEWCTPGMWLYTVTVDPTIRADLLNNLQAQGIDVRAIWPAIPDNPAFAAFEMDRCTVARAIAARAIWLPTSATMTYDDCQTIAEAFRQVEAVL